MAEKDSLLLILCVLMTYDFLFNANMLYCTHSLYVSRFARKYRKITITHHCYGLPPPSCNDMHVETFRLALKHDQEIRKHLMMLCLDVGPILAIYGSTHFQG